MSEIDVNNFDRFRIQLASSEQIRQWSRGEVKKPETINYRTLKPEKDGLFCEKIFGPTKDWECYCGKYKRVRFKGIICERCGVEVTRAKVRRDRMGHIELAAPVSHIWYFKGVPSRLGYLLDITPKDLEKVLYFASSIITSVQEEDREADLAELRDELEADYASLDAELAEEVRAVEEEAERLVAVNKGEIEPEEGEIVDEETPVADRVKKIETEAKRDVRDLEDEYTERKELLRRAFDEFCRITPKYLVGDEQLYREMKLRWGNYFRGGMGAEAVKDLLEQIDLEALSAELREDVRNGKGAKRARAAKRLKVATSFITSGNKPQWMILDAIPVIPPDLRPMVQLDGGRFATSDLNDLYRRVINRNNRLKRLLDLGAPEIIVNNEKRMLQEAVDALFDNGRRGRPVTGPGNRPLKSISDMLKGKQGRFRQNLLGKRVDYSGRSVIVVGPELKLHQCGLPKVMALELFKPFVMKRLVDLEYAQNIKSAKRMVDRQKGVVWDVLEEVIREHPVLLNRAPTLHRLGIQAFEPVLVEGKAIRIHPLVCTAFNADFDGDQMAVHVPLSAEAQAEARILMLSTNNIKSPAHGRPLTTPTQDMVIGLYYLTAARAGLNGEGRAYVDFDDAICAYDNRTVDLQAMIEVRLAEDIVEQYDVGEDADGVVTHKTAARERKAGERIRTTVGRITFNRALPADHAFVNREIDKKGIAAVVEECSTKYGTVELARILDDVKRLGFHYATRAGVTVSVWDAEVPAEKPAIIARAEEELADIDRKFDQGFVSAGERHQSIIQIWDRVTDEVGRAMAANFEENHPFNPIFMMANSGARGNIKQVRQLAGMRGLMANPQGRILDIPIKANFREGLSVLEYFISTHGARKGLADTALRTADSGYLTRRLVDVAQDVIVRSDDCGDDEGVGFKLVEPDGRIDRDLVGRCLATPVAHPKTGEILKDAGEYITSEADVQAFVDAGVDSVRARTVMTCRATQGICEKCYGWDLAAGRPVDIGTAVGIIAAQSIGEPGTQLTMRTFHTGGVAGEDITHGLPRVQELFEARHPKGAAMLAGIGGALTIEEADKVRKLTITDPKGHTEEHTVPRRARLRPGVAHGGTVEAGMQLTEGSVDPHELLHLRGANELLRYIVSEVQAVYNSQGVDINDKHIEVIARQMMRKLTVLEPGDAESMLPGALVDRAVFNEENERIIAEGGKPATAVPVLLGITKASLATESFLSAASFQETTRVLTDAAIAGKEDQLLGLKENVIIGKLIPAATGMKRYRSVALKYKGEIAEWTPSPTGGPLPDFAPDELKELEAMLPAPSAIESPFSPEEAAEWFADLPGEGDTDAFDVEAFTGMVFDPNAEMPTGTIPMDTPLIDIDVPTRYANILADEGIETLGQLLVKTGDELLAIKGFGAKALEEVERILGERGLVLRA
ncbi:MAG: DNA-directed RNA polymerase subunit beta' [Actinobacteria bacterium]|nr:MAG: DNA-directed RNA polymerase subunit beta' [Actinomycetota bacterium]